MEVTPYQIDVLKELINIGVGRAAGILNRMLRYHIVLQVPDVKIVTHKELTVETANLNDDHLAAVEMSFTGPFSGTAALVFSSHSASKLVSILVDEQHTSTVDFDLLRIGTLQEVGNIVLNGVMGSIANILNQPIDYAPPTFEEGQFESMVLSQASEPDATVLLAQTHFSIQQVLIEGDIIIIFEVGAFDVLLSHILGMIADQVE
ncbi:MAG: chemotaxis protein CheC [Acidobacteria bacterium]|nr:MAG: chemotaxis protein CheC [Acidobacteriota bacterium]